MHQQAEDSKPQTVASEFMRRNMHRLAELVGLDETDCKILTFVVVIHNERLLDDTGDCWASFRRPGCFRCCQCCWSCRKLRCVPHWVHKGFWHAQSG